MAVGLETAHPDVLARLNKRMTLAGFRRAADFLAEEDIALRVFILLNPPFLAGRAGAGVGVPIARRGGGRGRPRVLRDSDARAATARWRRWSRRSCRRGSRRSKPPSSTACRLRGPVVLADLWDAERFVRCPCDTARLSRLAFMNRHQRVPAPAGGVCEHGL